MHNTATQGTTILPQKLPIRRRDLVFEQQHIAFDRWHPQGNQTGHLFNGLSITFPRGERHFVHSVRHYMERMQKEAPQFMEQIRGFMGQESIHGREHERWNQAMAAAGYPVDALERIVGKVLDGFVYKLPPVVQLANTAAAEHLTAIGAGLVLSDPKVLEGVDPKAADFWRWHAIEETEHKAVAYEVYRTVATRDLGPVGAYLVRVTTMLLASILFNATGTVFQLVLVAHDRKLTDLGGWWRFLKVQFIQPGFAWRLLIPYLRYYLPGFHPWQHDNQRLVERWKHANEPSASASG